MFWQIVVFPFLLGLIGFFEPCSLGANSLFVAHTRRFTRGRRLAEGGIFVLVRAFVLSLLGLTVAFVGKRFFVFQSGYFVVLGGLYVVLGILYIIAKHKGISFPTLHLGKWAKGKTVLLGVLFGFAIPACAIPLILALLSQSLIVGNVLAGFVSMFMFGVALSLPLIVVVSSKKSERVLLWLRDKTLKYTYLPGVLLVIIGIATMLSSVWWLSA